MAFFSIADTETGVRHWASFAMSTTEAWDRLEQEWFLDFPMPSTLKISALSQDDIDLEIVSLLNDAACAGDCDMVALCHSALLGEPEDISKCFNAIIEGQG